MSLVADLAGLLARAEEYATAERAVRAGEDVTLAAPGVVRPFLVAALFRAAPASTLVVVSGADAAERFARQLAAFLPRGLVLSYPLRQASPWARDASDAEVVGLRARALHALETGSRAIVVASARSLLRAVPPMGSRAFDPLVLEKGMLLDLEQATTDLARMGYERVETAEARGQFAVRGGVLDVFPSEGAQPVRAELAGDEVESLRRYVSSTGQSIGDAGPTEAFPCREVRLGARAARAAKHALGERARTDDRLARDLELITEGVYFNGIEAYLPVFYRTPGRVTDYLRPDACVVVVEPRSLFGDAARWREEVGERAVKAGRDASGLYLDATGLDLGGRRRTTILSVLRAGAGVDASVTARRPDVSGGERGLTGGIRGLLDGGHTVAMAVHDPGMRARVERALVDAGIGVAGYTGAVVAAPGTAEDAPAGLAGGVVTFVDADVPAGFVVPEAALALVSADDVFPRTSRPADARGGAATEADISFDYRPGDYVVHATHGIARLADVVREEVLGVERDYLLLEYAAGDRLFVPLEQMHKVGKYVGPDATAPRLTRLDSADWSRALGRARKATRTLAFDLVDLYARRSAAEGYAFEDDTPWQAQMEADFPFEETPDQLAAIAAVKADMQSARPMDRLVAGDVGYGKTEVAVRAAFKAVQAGKQAMVLCPTTVLAQQHLVTFSERYEPFPVRVDLLSRFRTRAEQRRVVEGFAAGAVDVLIGTHRLLSPDVVPADLGLVIVDEEQRFGVRHKEHLKHLREQIDVLTLSATPIPRTLQMALSGVRDLTVIDTPPPDRFPVDVHVGEYDPDLVQAAVRAEMERGGQVYYVYNRVKDIEDAVGRVRLAAPEARVAVAHGQMPEKQLERVMAGFSAGEHDVLVSTTIVESGLDNPHTNTLVIEDSQRLGLAQLYQLKGRVGRSHVKAHAYFFFPRHAGLTEEAAERLVAVREHAELGSGVKIAMRDLEIRGAGDLLGAEQHGNMGAVGFELYARMLREAVSEVRGETPVVHPDVRVDLPVPAFLPEEYVPAVDDRVRWYRRLAACRTHEAVERARAELEQGEGPLPGPARDLLALARVRVLAGEAGVATVTGTAGTVTLEGVEVPVEPGESPVDAASRALLELREPGPADGAGPPRPVLYSPERGGSRHAQTH